MSTLPSVNEASFSEISKSAKRKSAHFERHLINEKLNDVQRLLYLLKSNIKIQRQFGLASMEEVFRQHKNEAIATIIPFLNDTLWKESPEVQKLFAEHISSIFPLLPEEQMRTMFGLIKTMLSLRDPAVVSAWEGPLLDSIAHVPIDVIRNELIKFCMEKGKLSETEKNRIYACKMFGAFSSRLSGHEIEDLFINKAISMCQDTAYGVRREMADQLPTIAKAVGLTKTKSVLAGELFQLVNDETRDVKQVAFLSLVELLDFFDSAFQKTKILPIFLQWMKRPPSDLYRLLISRFGEFVWKLSPLLNDESSVTAFCSFYNQASGDQDPLLREYCAYNFPALLKSIGGRRYTTHLSKTFFSLCQDREPNIRRRMAAGFHEVANMIGPDQATASFRGLFVKLLRDDDFETRAKVVANMHVIFDNFLQPPDSTKEEVFSDLLPELIQYHQSIPKVSWSSVESFFDNFQHFGNYFSKDSLVDVIIPMVKTQLQLGSAPMKLSLVNAAALILRKLESNSKQVEIFCQMIEELRYSRNYQNRMTFIDLCEAVMRHYSARFFYNNFVDQIVTMHNDRVPNVRRKLCQILPKIKIQLHIARKSSKKITEIAETLLQDKDKDVREAAQELNMELIRIEMERSARGKRFPFPKEEAADKRKEAEERSWGEIDLNSLRKRNSSSRQSTPGSNSSSPAGTPSSAGSTGSNSIGVSEKVLSTTSGRSSVSGRRSRSNSAKASTSVPSQGRPRRGSATSSGVPSMS